MYGGGYQRRYGGPGFDPRRLWRGPSPLTFALIAGIVAVFFLDAAGGRIGESLAFLTVEWWRRPWSLLTWALAGRGDLLGLLFSVGWVYLFAGSMERSWGTARYGAFLAATTALCALTFWLGSALLGQPAFLASSWAAMGPTVVAWALVNRREVIAFFFIPLPAWAVGALGAAMTWFYAGGQLIGLFALSGCAAAYLYVAQPTALRVVPGGKRPRSRFDGFEKEVRDARPSRNPLVLWKERSARKARDKKLEDMFRRSGYADDEERR
jgi:membrane associated rhomboid family serine protease